MPLIETGIAFVAVMLAASLFVSAVVQVLQGKLRYRGRTVAAMLETLLHGFQVFHDDEEALRADLPPPRPDAPPAEKQAWQAAQKACAVRAFAFAEDVLSDPSLHARDVKLEYGDDPAQLAALVEYIHPDDLIALAHNYAEAYPPGKGPESSSSDVASLPPVQSALLAPSDVNAVAARGNRYLPATWVGGQKAYATTSNFAAYVRRWFATIEATHTEDYRRRVRRLTVAVSCFVVVLFCLDGLQLLRALYQSRSGRDAIVGQVSALQSVAARLGTAGVASEGERDSTTKDLLLEMQKTATILDEANVGLGWQSSWLVRRWCAFKHACAEPAPSARRLVADVVQWLLGLAFSCVMLSFGAPFWARTLQSMLNLRNQVQQTRQAQAAPTTTVAPASTPAPPDWPPDTAPPTAPRT